MTDAAHDLLDALEATWEATIALCSGLTSEEWALSTGCPGWTIQDQVSHLVGLESALAGLGEPEVSLPDDLPHVKDDASRYMETHVAARRALAGEEVLAEFRTFAPKRIVALRQLAETAPHENAVKREALSLRVFDSWLHEQDIRRALRRNGGLDSPGARVVIPVLFDSVGYALAKKARIDKGRTIELRVGSEVYRYVRGEDGRVVADSNGSTPDATLVMELDTFIALMAGRSDPGRYEVLGDQDLGKRVAENMGVTP